MCICACIFAYIRVIMCICILVANMRRFVRMHMVMDGHLRFYVHVRACLSVFVCVYIRMCLFECARNLYDHDVACELA